MGNILLKFLFFLILILNSCSTIVTKNFENSKTNIASNKTIQI
ncbi:MAG: hypothetical protein KatS3mg068_1800 [Candidatus Sericytochromatia bacterium]|nr:MAG: hypothetical protein KatS3mg068_1800 [Candidatus Sericytochromatia bacterium]